MHKKALTVAVAAVALAAPVAAPANAVASTAAATTTDVKPVIEFREGFQKTVTESNSEFVCPPNEVLTGRWHEGDENGSTWYGCSRIFVDNVQAVVSPGVWSNDIVESSGHGFSLHGQDAVLVGRRHRGDENDKTAYRSARVFWTGGQLRISTRRFTESRRENNFGATAQYGEAMIGRCHGGDENGFTFYEFGKVSLTPFG